MMALQPLNTVTVSRVSSYVDSHSHRVTPLSVSPHPHRKFYFVLFSLAFYRIFVVLVNMFYFFEGMSSED